MDNAVFSFLGIDHEQLLETIRGAKDDAKIANFTAPYVSAKSHDEIEAWNREWLSHKPEGQSREAFLNLREQIAPDRTDVTTWSDLLDLDEKRDVPVRK
jgi:hypothetical protein